MRHADLHQKLGGGAEDGAAEHQQDRSPSARGRSGCLGRNGKSTQNVSTQNSRESALKWVSVDPDQREVTVTEDPLPQSEEHPHHLPQRGFIAEWTVTIILLLFGTTTLVQAFVIPTGSMEDTLLIGDHLLVDKLAYAPSGPVSKHLLPYEQPKHGDIIVFRYPVDITQTFVKRCIGVPGDHIK